VFASGAGSRAPFRKLRTDDLPQSWRSSAKAVQCSLGSRTARRYRKLILIRSRRETVTFRHPFRIKGIDRLLQAGAYEVATDEETIEGLSFPCFRRVATLIMVPGAPPHQSSIEMISISSVDLADAQQADAVASQ
jgi:hypothetical protein